MAETFINYYIYLYLHIEIYTHVCKKGLDYLDWLTECDLCSPAMAIMMFRKAETLVVRLQRLDHFAVPIWCWSARRFVEHCQSVLES